MLLKCVPKLRGPLELTFRLGEMEVMGDFDEQFHQNRDKHLTGVDQRANAQFFPVVLMFNKRKGTRSKLEEDAGCRILFQGSYYSTCVC